MRVLREVAQRGSFSAAAEALSFTQSAVSQQIAALEREAGTTLVERSVRGIRLTDAGRALVRHTEAILGRLAEAEAELEAIAGLRGGRLRMASFESAGATLMPLAIATFRDRHPAVELSLSLAEPMDSVPQLKSGELEIALSFDPNDVAVPSGDSIEHVHLLDDPLYLISRKRRDTIAAHRDSAWVGGCERCTAELVALCERLGGFTPRIAHHSDDIVVMQTFVAAGMGVTTLPGLALEAHRVPGIESTELPDHPRRIYAATYGDPPDPPPIAALRAALKAP